MATPTKIAALIADKVETLPRSDQRRLIAIAGPPASGKSTVAQAVCDALNARGTATDLVAMDGFHMDNSVLNARDLRARKGAPQTFDLDGFAAILARLRQEGEVFVPTFDRARDASIAASAVVSSETRTIVVEGNYLLLNEPGWRDLSDHWALSVALMVSPEVLEGRLLARWLSFGFSAEAARLKAESNDLPNAMRVLENSLRADLEINDET